MGVQTLEEFHTDLQGSLGNKGIVGDRLTRWVNSAYFELTGAIDFEILEATAEVATVAAQQAVAIPNTDSTTVVVKHVRDNTSDNKLGWLDKAELLRKKRTPTATPLYWTRHAATILLHPVPDDIFALELYLKKDPTPLADTSSKTIIPASWDQAIQLLATHYGLLATGDEQRAMVWLNRAIAYLQTRTTEEDIHASTTGLSGSQPGGVQALIQKLQMQAGG